MDKQDQLLNAIQEFLKTTTEPFDDWDWDGKELKIILNGEITERYTLKDIQSFLTQEA